MSAMARPRAGARFVEGSTMRHVVVMCRSRECDLYCVRTHTRRSPALMRFDNTKSTRR